MNREAGTGDADAGGAVSGAGAVGEIADFNLEAGVGADAGSVNADGNKDSPSLHREATLL